MRTKFPYRNVTVPEPGSLMHRASTRGLVVRLSAVMGLALGTRTLGMTRQQEQRVHDTPVRELLTAALSREREAQAYYAAALKRYANKEPFPALCSSETDHERRLLDLFDKRGMPVPPSRVTPVVVVPDTFRGACLQGIALEKNLVTTYDGLLKRIKNLEVRRVLAQLQCESGDTHVHELQRAAAGVGKLGPAETRKERKQEPDLPSETSDRKLDAFPESAVPSLPAGDKTRRNST